MIIITGLFVYPVKSMQGIALEQATLTDKGLAYDRTWMVTDAEGEFLSQRDLAAMATIGVSITETVLRLQHPSAGILEIPLERNGGDDAARTKNHVERNGGLTDGEFVSKGNHQQIPLERNGGLEHRSINRWQDGPTKQSADPVINVTVWGDTCQAYDEGPEASRWLTDILGEVDGAPLRLVRFAPESIRPVETDSEGQITSVTAFADGYPYLIATEESLSELNLRLMENGADPVTMDRFRANIVIRGAGPFAEDQMDVLSDARGRYSLAVRKPCKRCKVTTVDQHTGEISNPKEPLKTLASMNPFPDLPGAYFGQNAVLLGGNKTMIRVGDKLTESYK
jgi:uncharacterized protein